MRITRTEKKYPGREPEEPVGFVGRYVDRVRERPILIVPALLLLLFFFYLLQRTSWLFTYGRIMAHDVSIASTSVSRISAIHVALGERVIAGQSLVSLNKHSLNAELYRSNVALQKNRIELEGLVSRGVSPTIVAALSDSEYRLEQQRLKLETARATLARRVADRDNAREDLAARESLLLLDGITSQQLEQAKQAVEDIQGQVNIAYALVKEQEAAVKRAEHAVAQAEKNLRFAESKLRSDIELKELEIARLEQVIADSNVVLADQDLFSPVDGRVSWVTKQAGEVVDHQDVILNVTADAPRWVEAYVYASDWQDLQNGARARVRIEHEGGNWLEGCVLLSFPTERPMDQEYPVGQRTAPSPRRLDETVYPVQILFQEAIPAQNPAGMIVRVKIETGVSDEEPYCQSSPSESTPGS